MREFKTLPLNYMEKFREDLLDEYTDKINKRGMGYKELYELRNKMIDVVESDYQKTQILGLDEFSQKRGYYNYGTTFRPDKDDIPESLQQIKSEMAILKSIMIDPSSTVEGAKNIISKMSKHAGRELDTDEALNLVKLLGKAEAKGMKSKKDFMYGKTSFKDIVRMVEKRGALSDEEIDTIAQKLADDYASDVGLSKMEKPPTIVRPTPKLNKPIDASGTKRHKTSAQVKKPNTKVEHKKVRLSEAKVHKRGAVKSINVKPKSK